jgi:hypothetical protein
MSPSSSSPGEVSQFLQVSSAETEILLKALNYYQIHLFDIADRAKEASQGQDLALVTSLIKKVHKVHEALTR